MALCCPYFSSVAWLPFARRSHQSLPAHLVMASWREINDKNMWNGISSLIACCFIQLCGQDEESPLCLITSPPLSHFTQGISEIYFVFGLFLTGITASYLYRYLGKTKTIIIISRGVNSFTLKVFTQEIRSARLHKDFISGPKNINVSWFSWNPNPKPGWL